MLTTKMILIYVCALLGLIFVCRSYLSASKKSNKRKKRFGYFSFNFGLYFYFTIVVFSFIFHYIFSSESLHSFVRNFIEQVYFGSISTVLAALVASTFSPYILFIPLDFFLSFMRRIQGVFISLFTLQYLFIHRSMKKNIDSYLVFLKNLLKYSNVNIKEIQKEKRVLNRYESSLDYIHYVSLKKEISRYRGFSSIIKKEIRGYESEI